MYDFKKNNENDDNYNRDNTFIGTTGIIIISKKFKKKSINNRRKIKYLIYKLYNNS